jgi:hypothetical protein
MTHAQQLMYIREPGPAIAPELKPFRSVRDIKAAMRQKVKADGAG